MLKIQLRAAAVKLAITRGQALTVAHKCFVLIQVLLALLFFVAKITGEEALCSRQRSAVGGKKSSPKRMDLNRRLLSLMEYWSK